jgi:hypothetical protein
MSKESLERVEEAFTKFVYSSEYNEQCPGYSGFMCGAIWFRQQVLDLLNSELDITEYNDSIDTLRILQDKVNKI